MRLQKVSSAAQTLPGVCPWSLYCFAANWKIEIFKISKKNSKTGKNVEPEKGEKYKFFRESISFMNKNSLLFEILNPMISWRKKEHEEIYQSTNLIHHKAHYCSLVVVQTHPQIHKHY